jgi:predicted small metal-binding protein
MHDKIRQLAAALPGSPASREHTTPAGLRVAVVTRDSSAPDRLTRLRVTHPSGRHHLVVQMSRTPAMAGGAWHVSLAPSDAAGAMKRRGTWDARRAGTWGPALMRDMGRHLKEHHGVERIVARRITGARRHSAQRDIEVLNKGLQGAAEGGFWGKGQLDLFDAAAKPAKAELRFHETKRLEYAGSTHVKLHVVVPGQRHAVGMDINSAEHYGPGAWYVRGIYHADPHTGEELRNTYSRDRANVFGPGVMRQIARHLKATYGMTRLAGFRVTGMRAQGGRYDKKKANRALGGPEGGAMRPATRTSTSA